MSDFLVSAIAMVRAYGLEIGVAALPEGVRPLHRSGYRLVGEWTHADDWPSRETAGSTSIGLDLPPAGRFRLYS